MASMDFFPGNAPAPDLIDRLHQQAQLFLKDLEMGAQAVAAERERLEKVAQRAQPQSRLEFLKREQEAAQMASTRLEIYRLELHRHAPFCPYCWMVEGRRIKLKPMLEVEEALACELCGSAY